MQFFRNEELLGKEVEKMNEEEKEQYKLDLYDYLGELEEMDKDETDDDFDEWADLCDEVRDLIEYVEQI